MDDWEVVDSALKGLADSDRGRLRTHYWGDIRIALARELHCSQLPVRYSPLAGSRWVETAAGLS